MIKETVKGYFVDSEGKVFSKNGKEKKAFVGDRGYVNVILWENNRPKTFLVHRLIAKAFIPNPENKPCVNHIDGNKTNNTLSNLEWVTYSENTLHALETKLKIPELGENVHNAKITNEQAREICELMQAGYRDIEICEKLDVRKNIVGNIRKGVSWVFISSNYNIPKKSLLISEETVHWICNMIQEGYRNKDIVDMSTNPRVNKSIVTKIKNKKTHIHISCFYKF